MQFKYQLGAIASMLIDKKLSNCNSKRASHHTRLYENIKETSLKYEPRHEISNNVVCATNIRAV